MTTLLDLSGEVFERILLALDDLADLARISQVCRAVHELIYASDSHLWRTAFLMRYDDPRAEGREIDWKAMVQARTEAQLVIASPIVGDHHERAITTLLELPHQCPPGNFVTGSNLPLLNSLLGASGRESLYARSDRPLLLSEGAKLSQLDASEASAKLSVYLGLGAPPRRRLKTSQRNGARALVYDLRTWNEDGEWGPFKEDGSIDWNKAEAIMMSACHNAIDLVRSLGASRRTRLPCHLSGARPYSAPGWDDKMVEGDWAGVTGHWRRNISFCDWNDLQRFQHAVRNGEGSRFFATRFAGEAVRLLSMQLYIVGFVPVEEDGAPPDRPTILFEGVAEGGSTNEATVHGYVKMNKNRDIKWRLTSRYGGQDRWYSIGAQVGGEQSAYGVLGVWSGLDHDFEHGDPAGPWWLWKVDPEEPDPHDAESESEQHPELEPVASEGETDDYEDDHVNPIEPFDSDGDSGDELPPGVTIQDVLAYLNSHIPAGDELTDDSDDADFGSGPLPDTLD